MRWALTVSWSAGWPGWRPCDGLFRRVHLRGQGCFLPRLVVYGLDDWSRAWLVSALASAVRRDVWPRRRLLDRRSSDRCIQDAGCPRCTWWRKTHHFPNELGVARDPCNEALN